MMRFLLNEQERNEWEQISVDLLRGRMIVLRYQISNNNNQHKKGGQGKKKTSNVYT